MRCFLLALIIIAMCGCIDQRAARALVEGVVDVQPRRAESKDRTDEVVKAINDLGEKLGSASAGRGQESPPAAPQPSASLQKRRVKVYSPSWCGPCMVKLAQIRAEVASDQDNEYEFVTDWNTFPANLRRIQMWSGPVVYFEDSKSATGWSWINYWPGLSGLKQSMDSQVKSSSAQTTPTTYSSPEQIPDQWSTPYNYSVAGQPAMATSYQAQYAMTYGAPVTTQYTYTSPMMYTYTAPVVTGARSNLRYSRREWGAHSSWGGDLRAHMAAAHGLDTSAMDDYSVVAAHDQLASGTYQSRRDTRRIQKYGHP